VADSVPSPSIHLGRVTSFDQRRGWGTVTEDSAAEDSAAEFDFHATAIADGARTIAVGTSVTFLIRPGHRGRYEARSLTPCDPAGPPAGVD
jgi:cold shock CspA family protein